MHPKPVAQWSVDDVAVWLTAIGLGGAADMFTENAVDGSFLLTLSKDDLTDDLGLTNLQAKKELDELDLALSFSSDSEDDTSELEDEIHKLKANYANLQAQLAEKDAEIAELQKKLESPPPPQPQAAPALERRAYHGLKARRRFG